MEYPTYESSRELSLQIPMEDIMTTELHSFIEKRVSDILVGYHNGEGIILPDSVSIISRSPLLLNPKESTYKVIVRYNSKVIDTPTGSEISAKVESIISSGLICQVYDDRLPHPLIRAYVPLTIHNKTDQERIKTIRKDDIVRIRSINRKGSYSDSIITMIGTFVDLVKRPNTIDNPLPPSQSLALPPPSSLPAPGSESEYDARGDGDPIGPHSDKMSLPGIMGGE